MKGDQTMDTVSLSDIAAVTRGNDNDGWGNGGAWWIIILFLFVFMGGGFWGNRNGDYGQYATAATQQEILFGQQFSQINDRLTNIGNGICNLKRTWNSIPATLRICIRTNSRNSVR